MAPVSPLTFSRRRALGALAGLPAAWVAPSLASAGIARSLVAGTRQLEVNGRAAKVFQLLGADGRPGLSFVAGEHFRVRFDNRSGEATVVHWHGLTPPAGQDGVPEISQPMVPAGGGYDYDFPLKAPGSFWMHSHVGLQEQRLMAAPLIVHDPAEATVDEQNHVVLLHDFTFRDPGEILAELKSGKGAHARHAMPEMDMSKMDAGQMQAMAAAMLNDVTFDAYLANDRTLDDPELVAVEKGGRLRLRVINGAAASNMWVDLGLLTGELIAVDGHPVEPVKASVFPLAIAQRADIRLEVPREAGAWPVTFRPEGVAARTGIMLATPGAAIGRLSGALEQPSPALDLALEARLRPRGAPAAEPVTRTDMLMLTGGGGDYLWGFNGKPSLHDTLLTVRPGERVAVMLHNMTMMAHPMHLHGHVFKVIAIDGAAVDGAIRDTVLVPPMRSVTIAFDADNAGTWPFHCHHIYHMNSGMMGVVSYISAA